MNKHLFLTGFMGAGKTSVGQALAIALNLPFIDLDQLIVQSAGKNIPAIFAEDGELFFRNLETNCLGALAEAEPSVVSTGGGIIGRPVNVTFMQKYGTIVYLSANWETLKQRIGEGSGRPLARSDGDWEATKALWLERQPLYEQANIIIRTDRQTIPEIVGEIRHHATL